MTLLVSFVISLNPISAINLFGDKNIWPQWVP